MITKQLKFEVISDIIKQDGHICMHCHYSDKNRCLHNEMRVNRTDKIIIDGKEAQLTDHFTIPHYDFFCGLWEESK